LYVFVFVSVRRDLDVSSGDGGGVEGIWIGDADFRVEDAFEVVVGVVGLEFHLVDGAAVFVGQVAQVGAFANVETEFEGLALEPELLEGVRASVGALLMRESFITDVVVVSDVVALGSEISGNFRRSRRRWRCRRFRHRRLVRNHIRLHSDSFLHGHLAVDFGKLDVVDIDDAPASSYSITSSSRSHGVAERDLFHPLDAGRVLVRSRLAPRHQSAVIVDEDSEVLMPTDFEQRQFAILDLIGPCAPDVVLRLHDDFQSVIQPFGRHIIGIEENEALGRINESDLEGDGEAEVALGQVARARELV